MATTISQQDREILHTILRNVDDAQLAAHNSARTFRNLLAIVALGLAIGAVVFPSIAGRADPSVLNLSGSGTSTASPAPSPSTSSAPPTPSAPSGEQTSASAGSPSVAGSVTAQPTSATAPATPGGQDTPGGQATPGGQGTPDGQATPDGQDAPTEAEATGLTLRTLATVELWGMVGGLIGALSPILRVRGSTTPIGLQLAQFAVKLPTGAWTGLVGVIMLQSTLLPSVQPAPTYTLAAYAIVFGAGQQALTRFVDQRASALLEKTKTQGETTVQVT